MEGSLVGKSVHEVLQGVESDEADYDPERALRKLHERLLRRGHFGPYEHPQAFFVAEGVSRVCMAQITRHRHISFDVQSMRYCNFEDAEPKVPDSFKDNDSGILAVDYADEGMEQHFQKSVNLYQDMVDGGIKKEDARFVLPLGTTVNMSFSANPRTLMHLIDMRHAGDAQWEAQEFAKQVLDEAREWAPITFEMYEEYAKGSSKKAA
jgi:thymidylate synthase (FAD)